MAMNSRTRSQLRSIRDLIVEMQGLRSRADDARCRLWQHVADSRLIGARNHRMILRQLRFRAPFQLPGATPFGPPINPLSEARFEKIEELLDIFGWNFDPAKRCFKDRAGQRVDSDVILVAIPSLLPAELEAYTQRQIGPTGQLPSMRKNRPRLHSLQGGAAGSSPLKADRLEW